MSQANVPYLRFPEFNKVWKSGTVSDFGSFYYGRSAPKWSLSDDAPTPCVRYGELYTKFGTQINETFSRTNIDPKKLRFSKGGEVLVPRVGERPMDFANCSHLTIPDVAIGEMISVYETKQNGDFVANYFNSVLQIPMAKMVEGASVSNLYYDYVSKLSVRFPDLIEQQKIADFLTAVDKKIEALKIQLKGWREFKIGMMQSLFSQTIRFKADDGSEFSKWKMTPLKHLAKRSTEKNTDFKISKVLSNSATMGVVAQTDYFERKITTAANLDGYYIVKVGDFIYNPRISSTAPVGPISRNNLENGVMSPLYTVFRPFSQSALFLEAYFKSRHWNEYIFRASNVGARHDRMNISTSDFMNMPISLPSEPEQDKIINALAAIDSKVDALTDRLNSTQEFKRGLLQKMFV